MTERASTHSAESSDYLPGDTAAEKRSLAKWYAAARAALARNRPLTSAATPAAYRSLATDFSVAETAALRGVGAYKSEAPIRADSDPLIRSQAQYMALLEEGLSAAEAGELLQVDVSRVRQRLRDRSLFGIEHEGSWRLPRFQFERRVVIPGLAQILKALPPDLFPLDLVDWFLLPDPDLQLDREPTPCSRASTSLPVRILHAGINFAAPALRPRGASTERTTLRGWSSSRFAKPLLSSICADRLRRRWELPQPYIPGLVPELGPGRASCTKLIQTFKVCITAHR
jgi:hypothetical protein